MTVAHNYIRQSKNLKVEKRKEKKRKEKRERKRERIKGRSMVIKRIEFCIEFLKITMDLAAVVAEAARVLLSHAPQVPPVLPRQYSASSYQSSAYMIPYFP
ncbi:hypothetical protein HID58_032456 [Brassica napus]|uniref:Uncharacterized protein n=3 Tax=Brassica TaxID=3705 RepID=A0ABQ8BWF5_BRANA|nr:hypothetical protein HID58_032456 [Brassica napus]